MTEWDDDRLNKDWVIKQNFSMVITENELKCIWKPFVYMRRIHNGMRYNNDILPPSFGAYFSNGHIRINHGFPYILKVICKMNFQSYPFDTQICQVQFTNREFLIVIMIVTN